MNRARLILASVILAGVSAAAPRSEAAALIDHWDTAAVSDALSGLGAKSVKPITLQGKPGVLAQTADGLSIGVYAKGCAESADLPTPVCQAVEGVVSYDPGAGGDAAALAASLNHQYAAGKFMAEGDGSVRLTRYFVVEGGVSPANLKAQIGVFLAMATAAKQTVWNTPAPAVLPPPALPPATKAKP